MKTEIFTPPWWARVMNRVRAATPVVTHSVEHNGHGLSAVTSYADGRVLRQQLAWAEVNEAIAYKRDCYSVDLICIAFGNKGNGVEINEEMPEWNSIVKALPCYLPGCMSEDSWFQQVAFPAFETNTVHIFSRQHGVT
jgi:hypothetical protein